MGSQKNKKRKARAAKAKRASGQFPTDRPGSVQRFVNFKFADEHFRIGYDPAKAQREKVRLKATYDSSTSSVADMEFIVEWLLAAITSWNLRAEDGTILPITAATFDEIPYDLVLALVNEISADMNVR